MILASLDSYTTLVDPLWTRQPRAIVEAVTPLTPESAAVTLRTNRSWPGHLAGQHLTIGVDVAGVRHHRTYSLTSAASDPGRRLVEIAVRRVPGGVVSTALTDPAAVGTVLHLGPPTGAGLVASARPLLLLSGGSGITPTVGILPTLAAQRRAGQEVRDVVVVHHAPAPELTMFGAELDRLATDHPWCRVDVRHTRTGGSRLDAASLATTCPDWRDRDVRVCGPSGLVAEWAAHWSAADLVDRFTADPFDAPLPPATPVDGPVRHVVARFARSAVRTDTTTGATLLDAAEAAGVPAPSGCRRGVCHTCTTRLVAGRTVDRRDGRTSAPGDHVQLCVHVAATDVELDA